ncbi:MAG: hypothetical protein ACYC7F_14300, partial [Gemmatimonadaceae bacterium]
MLLAADGERVRLLLAGLPRTLPRQIVRSVLELPQALENPNVRVLLFDPNGVTVSFVQSLVLSDINTMTYYLDFVTPSPHISSTGGTDATTKSIRDTIVPRGTAGARAAESAVYVIVSRRGA